MGEREEGAERPTTRELMTQFEMTTSTAASATGRCSISPSRNSTVGSSPATFARAVSTISGVMSTPMT
jgi:hypothetical protein